jgi:hypothetical protein
VVECSRLLNFGIQNLGREAGGRKYPDIGLYSESERDDRMAKSSERKGEI